MPNPKLVASKFAFVEKEEISLQTPEESGIQTPALISVEVFA